MSIYNDHKVCNVCGQKNPVGSNFCIKCGEDIELLMITKDIYTRELEAFIGNNSDFYIEKKKTMEEKSKVNSWNWAAFFISPIWFLYRKMYVYGLGIVALNIVFSNMSFYSNIISLLIYIGAGTYGNTLYLNHVDKQLAKAQDLDMDSRSEFIRKKGGVSILSPIAVFAVITIIQYYVFAAIMQ